MKNSTNINRIAEIQEGITGHNPLTLSQECKADYTDIERIHYVENRMAGFNSTECHQFILEDREFEYDF